MEPVSLLIHYTPQIVCRISSAWTSPYIFATSAEKFLFLEFFYIRLCTGRFIQIMLVVLFLAVLTFRARTALSLGLVSFPLKISLPEKKKLLNSPFKMLVCIHIKVHKAMFPFFLCKIFFIVRVYLCTWVSIGTVSYHCQLYFDSYYGSF